MLPFHASNSRHMTNSLVIHDPDRGRFLLPVREVLWLIGANDFLQLSDSQTAVSAQ